MAMFMRIGLLLLLSVIIGLVEPLITVFEQAFSGRDLILLAGGLFLIWKSTGEIHHSLEGDEAPATVNAKANLMAIIVQIILIDLVFSLDSIITAVGMVDDVRIMIAAVVISLGLMMLFAKGIGQFVDAHPSIKMLALSFWWWSVWCWWPKGLATMCPKAISTLAWLSPLAWKCSIFAFAKNARMLCNFVNQPCQVKMTDGVVSLSWVRVPLLVCALWPALGFSQSAGCLQSSTYYAEFYQGLYTMHRHGLDTFANDSADRQLYFFRCSAMATKLRPIW